MTHDTLNTTPFEPKIYVVCAEDKQAKDKCQSASKIDPLSASKIDPPSQLN